MQGLTLYATLDQVPVERKQEFQAHFAKTAQLIESTRLLLIAAAQELAQYNDRLRHAEVYFHEIDGQLAAAQSENVNERLARLSVSIQKRRGFRFSGIPNFRT